MCPSSLTVTGVLRNESLFNLDLPKNFIQALMRVILFCSVLSFTANWDRTSSGEIRIAPSGERSPRLRTAGSAALGHKSWSAPFNRLPACVYAIVIKIHQVICLASSFHLKSGMSRGFELPALPDLAAGSYLPLFLGGLFCFVSITDQQFYCQSSPR